MSRTTTEFSTLSLRRDFFSARRPLLLLWLAVALLALVGQPHASAAPINYGDFSGDTVTYVDVTEDSDTGDPLPLFGAPSVSADSLDFNPVAFNANTNGAGGNDATNASLTFMVEAHPLHVIKNLTLSEAGDTTLSGFGTDATFTDVSANVFVDILEVDGVGITPISFNDSMSFTPSGGSYGLGTDGGGGPVFETVWEGSLFVDIMAELDDAVADGDIAPYDFGATKISLVLDNTLTALSEEGTFALIAKKNAGGVSFSINIPEPAAAALAVLGLAVGIVASRRRRCAS